MSNEQDQSQKTEDPTAKRLEEARKKGQIPVSREVANAFMLLGALVMIALLAPWSLGNLGNGLKVYLELPHELPVDPVGIRGTMIDAVADMLLVLAVPLAMFLVLGLAAAFVQNGFVVAGERLKPKFSHVSPRKGVGRLFSLRNLAEFVKGIAKIVIVGAVIGMLLLPVLPGLEQYAGMPLPTVLEETQDLSVRVLIGVLVVVAVVTILDVAYQRFDFLKQMRMTKQEVKDEHKQMEGDPKVKARMRQIRIERSRRRMMAAVPTADVVVTNPTHFAVAMKYEPPKMVAPVVVAKGADLIALRIRTIAEENGVPIVENPPLARALHAACELDQEIPPEHYRAVAEVISYVFRIRNRRLD